MSDPEKRKKYDEYGANWKQAEQFEEARRQQQNAGEKRRQYAGEPDSQYEFTQDDYSDFFSSMFGHSRNERSKARFRGNDYRATITLKLSEAYKTHQQTFTVNGKNIRITVPAGIENEQEIKIPGHGAPGVNGGPHGDLFITFEIQNDTNFTRKGDDLYRDVPLDLYKAVLGGEETVDTLNGKVKLKVAPGTQSASTVRLKGKGFPVYKQEGKSGDLYITWQLQVPVNLSPRERELFNELAKERQPK